MKKNHIKYILIPIFAIVIIILIWLMQTHLFNKKNQTHQWIEKQVSNNSEYSDLPATIPYWKDRPISQQYNEANYNNEKYSSRNTKISNDKIKENLETTTLIGKDTDTNTEHEKKAELYSIKDISEKCAIAIKFENDNDYYVYVNSYYKPTTLEEFIQDLNLKEITSFGTIEYNYWEGKESDNPEYTNVEFYDVKNDIIWKMLFNDTSLENIYSDADPGNYVSERFASKINISVDIPILGYENISVSLTDKGYLLTNILDTGKAFYIGEEKVQKFLNYIIDKYDGYKIVNTDQNEQETPKGNETIVMYDNTTGSTTNVTINNSNDNSTSPYEDLPSYNPSN